MDLYQKIVEAKNYITTNSDHLPEVAIVLGTGLNAFGTRLQDVVALPYVDVPYFVDSTVDGHSGQLLLGNLNGKSAMVMQGRFHYYEGYSMEQVTFPIRVMSMLGVKRLIITNASGSLNPDLKTGNVLIVKDHISFFGPNPLRGIVDERLGERFPDMTHTYDITMRKSAHDISIREKVSVMDGVYCYVQGPSLETPAEHRLLQMVGADAVGMSTVPEVIVAKQCGLDVCVLSCITNECMSGALTQETSLEEVVAAANAAEPQLSKLILGIVGSIPQ